MSGRAPRRTAFHPLHPLAAAAGEEPGTLAADGRTLAVSNRRGDHLMTRLVDGTFPDYRRLVPKDRTEAASVDRARVLEAVSRAMAVAAKGDAVTVEFGSGALTVSARTDGGSTCERVPAVFDGESRSIGFQPRYLRDMLAALSGETVELLPGGQMAPLLAREKENPNLTYLLMPMRT